jgi:hypothetical protein
VKANVSVIFKVYMSKLIQHYTPSFWVVLTRGLDRGSGTSPWGLLRASGHSGYDGAAAADRSPPRDRVCVGGGECRHRRFDRLPGNMIGVRFGIVCVSFFKLSWFFGFQVKSLAHVRLVVWSGWVWLSFLFSASDWFGKSSDPDQI